MEIFDRINLQLQNLFGGYSSNWVIRSNSSSLDIETCNGVATEDLQTNTCPLCVALNRTVLKNENKPQYTHPYCKCYFTNYNLNMVDLDFPMRKITQYLFTHPSKAGLMQSMGYTIEDANEIHQEIVKQTQNQFLKGNYILGTLDNKGQRLNISIKLLGKTQNKIYEFDSAWMAYPNGKLHNNTPFAKWTYKEYL